MGYVYYSGLRHANYNAVSVKESAEQQEAVKIVKPAVVPKPSIKVTAPLPVTVETSSVTTSPATTVVINDKTPAITKPPVAELMKPVLTKSPKPVIPVIDKASLPSPAIIDKAPPSKVSNVATNTKTGPAPVDGRMKVLYKRISGAPKNIMDSVERAVRIPFQAIGSFLEKKFPVLSKRVKEITLKGVKNIQCFVKTYPVATGLSITVIIVISLVWSQKKKNENNRLKKQIESLEAEKADLNKKIDSSKERSLELERMLNHAVVLCEQYSVSGQLFIDVGQMSEKSALSWTVDQIKMSLKQKQEEVKETDFATGRTPKSPGIASPSSSPIRRARYTGTTEELEEEAAGSRDGRRLTDMSGWM